MPDGPVVRLSAADMRRARRARLVSSNLAEMPTASTQSQNQKYHGTPYKRVSSVRRETRDQQLGAFSKITSMISKAFNWESDSKPQSLDPAGAGTGGAKNRHVSPDSRRGSSLVSDDDDHSLSATVLAPPKRQDAIMASPGTFAYPHYLGETPLIKRRPLDFSEREPPIKFNLDEIQPNAAAVQYVKGRPLSPQKVSRPRYGRSVWESNSDSVIDAYHRELERLDALRRTKATTGAKDESAEASDDDSVIITDIRGQQPSRLAESTALFSNSDALVEGDAQAVGETTVYEAKQDKRTSLSPSGNTPDSKRARIKPATPSLPAPIEDKEQSPHDSLIARLNKMVAPPQARPITRKKIRPPTRYEIPKIPLKVRPALELKDIPDERKRKAGFFMAETEYSDDEFELAQSPKKKKRAQPADEEQFPAPKLLSANEVKASFPTFNDDEKYMDGEVLKEDDILTKAEEHADSTNNKEKPKPFEAKIPLNKLLEASNSEKADTAKSDTSGLPDGQSKSIQPSISFGFAASGSNGTDSSKSASANAFTFGAAPKKAQEEPKKLEQKKDSEKDSVAAPTANPFTFGKLPPTSAEKKPAMFGSLPEKADHKPFSSADTSKPPPFGAAGNSFSFAAPENSKTEVPSMSLSKPTDSEVSGKSENKPFTFAAPEKPTASSLFGAPSSNTDEVKADRKGSSGFSFNFAKKPSEDSESTRTRSAENDSDDGPSKKRQAPSTASGSLFGDATKPMIPASSAGSGSSIFSSSMSKPSGFSLGTSTGSDSSKATETKPNGFSLGTSTGSDSSKATETKPFTFGAPSVNKPLFGGASTFGASGNKSDESTEQIEKTASDKPTLFGSFGAASKTATEEKKDDKPITGSTVGDGAKPSSLFGFNNASATDNKGSSTESKPFSIGNFDQAQKENQPSGTNAFVFGSGEPDATKAKSGFTFGSTNSTQSVESAPSNPNGFSFGSFGNSTNTTKPPPFGATVGGNSATSTDTSSSFKPAFGSSFASSNPSVDQSAPNGDPKSIFGATSTTASEVKPATTGFGTSTGFKGFGAAQTTESKPTFGFASATTTDKSISSGGSTAPFAFNAAPNTTMGASNAFGSSNAFQRESSAPPFGSNSSNNAFGFGSTTTKPFENNGAVTTSGASPFGSSNATPEPQSNPFTFGASAANNTNGAFGGTNGAFGSAQPTNAFGTNPLAAPAAAPAAGAAPVFGTNTAGAFSFSGGSNPAQPLPTAASQPAAAPGNNMFAPPPAADGGGRRRIMPLPRRRR